MNHRDVQPFMSRGLRFECQRCGACCSGSDAYVFLGPGEDVALARCLGMDLADFSSRYTRRAEGRLALVDCRNGDCCFLTDTGCAVYAARPYQCRSWPFWFMNVRSESDWRKAGESCSGIGRGRVHTVEEIQSWLSQRGKKSRS